MHKITIVLAAAAAAFLATPAHADLTKCEMTFDLSGWSAIYKKMSGQGKITCANGQTANVTIETQGGGLTFGKSEILNGKGDFSGAKDISELFGTYAEAAASGSATKGGTARVMTKGEVSLALSGEGRGWELGIAFGAFTIKKK